LDFLCKRKKCLAGGPIAGRIMGTNRKRRPEHLRRMDIFKRQLLGTLKGSEHNRPAHRLAERLHDRARDVGQVPEQEKAVRHLPDLSAEPVRPAAGGLLDKAALLQRVEDAECAALGKAERGTDLAKRDGAAGPEELENSQAGIKSI